MISCNDSEKYKIRAKELEPRLLDPRVVLGGFSQVDDATVLLELCAQPAWQACCLASHRVAGG